MIETLGQKLIEIKKEFENDYEGSSHIQEAIPISSHNSFPLNQQHLDLLHLFAQNNPIYYHSFRKTISNIPCMIYEGDINEYWLSSIQHSNSKAPFSPTWILSAYINSLQTKELGYYDLLDIGSGDGRIAYCAKIVGLLSYSIEIDPDLVDLQKSISDATRITFNPTCSDAINFDYSSLKLTKPAFFIGGLAKMGGDILADSIINKINTNLKENSCLVLAGTLSPKYSTGNMSEGGWGRIIKKNNLKVFKKNMLPTVWTFREPDETLYIFTKFN